MTTALHQALEAFPAVEHTVKPDDRTPEYGREFRKANQVRSSLFHDNLLTKVHAFLSLRGFEVPADLTPLAENHFANFTNELYHSMNSMKTAIDAKDWANILAWSLKLIYTTTMHLRMQGFSEEQIDLAMAEFHAHQLLRCINAGDIPLFVADLSPIVEPAPQPATKD